MNKQELINELKRISLEKQHKALTHPESKNYYEGMVIAYSQVVHMVNTVLKLDESQKPVVPQFVAEWFEENKDDLEFAIWELCVDSYGSTEQGMLNWIQQSENNPIETLIRMKDGYEVEKEPKYIVKIGKLYLKEPLGDTSNFTILTTWDKKCAYPFSSFHMADIHAAKFEGTVEEEEAE
ncbi:DUF1642 domain-containing protein [Enterococcus faecium]|uniref:DUF1642 domain-containing protein n=1 Tax=Enterococcus faecium TaxID=1352 RepID=UPI00115F008A|nr:DUF1642 domain-containing protein [Enterococcus faecium]